MFDIIIKYADGVIERVRGYGSRYAAELEIRRMRHDGDEILWARVDEAD